MKSLFKTTLILFALASSIIVNAQSAQVSTDTPELDDGHNGMEELAANSEAVLQEREAEASQKNDDMVLSAVDQEATLFRGKHEKCEKVFVIKCIEADPIEIDLNQTLSEDFHMDSTEISKLKTALQQVVDEINEEIEDLEELINTHIDVRKQKTEDTI